MTPRLKEIFNKEIQPALKDQFGFKNIYMAPRIEKVILNMGLGLDASDSKILKSCEEDMAKITGQKPVTTKFKKSVANFKTRKGVRKNYNAHDENNKFKTGDKVSIIESKPFSKNKKFQVMENTK